MAKMRFKYLAFQFLFKIVQNKYNKNKTQLQQRNYTVIKR